MNLEVVGLCFVTLTMTSKDDDEVYRLKIELKPSNMVIGQLSLTKLDLKTTFRDLIILSSYDR